MRAKKLQKPSVHKARNVTRCQLDVTHTDRLVLHGQICLHRSVSALEKHLKTTIIILLEGKNTLHESTLKVNVPALFAQIYNRMKQL